MVELMEPEEAVHNEVDKIVHVKAMVTRIIIMIHNMVAVAMVVE
jgi:hypothetical protein